MNRGEVYELDWPGVGSHPVVIVTRQAAIPILANVTAALVTSRVRGLPTEVALGEEHGLRRSSVVNCDNLVTVPKRTLGRRYGVLGPAEIFALDDALRIALELD